MSNCTCTIFGRPLADMAPADANCIRGHLAELDDCHECRSFRLRQAKVALDMGAVTIACAREREAGVPNVW